LIELRKKYEAFRRADYSNVKFVDHKSDQFVCEYSLTYKDDEFVVILNANPKISFEVNLPEGKWDVLVDENEVGVNSIKTVQNKATLNSSTGMVLKKK
jgi:pullulanase/glycogen debranching enzyme